MKRFWVLSSVGLVASLWLPACDGASTDGDGDPDEAICSGCTDPADSGEDDEPIGNGCVSEIPGGWVTLRRGSASQDIWFWDDDRDGLPDTAHCRDTGTDGSKTIALTAGWTAIDTSGTDYPDCAFDFGIYVGTEGDDIANATDAPGPVAMFGGPGADDLTAGGFGDYIHGGNGIDTLSGGAGNDHICVGFSTFDGTQQLDGGEGDDHIFGCPGKDVVHGGPGHDIVSGAGSSEHNLRGDEVYGDAGDDWVYGAGGSELVSGGEGDDHLHGGGGNEDYEGGPGNDVILAQDYFNDNSIDAGEDDDGEDEDTCYLDANNIDSSVDDSTSTGCEVRQPRQACDDHLLAAKQIGTGDDSRVRLYRLAMDGSEKESAYLQLSAGEAATGVGGIAFSPRTCDILVVLENVAGEQLLARYATPLAASSDAYVASNVWTLVHDGSGGADAPIVDIAINMMDRVAAIQSNAQVVQVDQPGPTDTSASKRHLHTIGGPGDRGVRISSDEPDTGLFLVLTQDVVTTEYDIWAAHSERAVHNYMIRPHKDELIDAAMAMDGHDDSPAGRLHQIGDDGLMWLRNRRGWPLDKNEDCSTKPCQQRVAAVKGPDYLALPTWYVP